MKTLNEFLLEREIKGTKLQPINYEDFANLCPTMTIDRIKDELNNNISIDSTSNNETCLLKIGYMTPEPFREKTIFLINNGANVNAIDEFGNNILHLIFKKYDKWHYCLNDLEKLIKLLMQKGIDINHKNSDGKTPLEILIYDYNDELSIIPKLRRIGFK